MRVLLDECVDHRLARDLANHEMSTVARMGWPGKENGELLGLAATPFDVFLTTDRRGLLMRPNPHRNRGLPVIRAATVRERFRSHRLHGGLGGLA